MEARVGIRMTMYVLVGAAISWYFSFPDTRIGSRLIDRIQLDISGVKQPERFRLAACPTI